MIPLHLIINCKRDTDYPLSTQLTTSYAYRMSMTNVNMNTVSTEPVTMLMVCILIDGKEILLMHFKMRILQRGF